ncbi:MAG TPA: small acid-soluble spore protein Tlp [Paenibacillus sp.]|nr:small acid-soluble spore protein Tlp [Paenibacillus sp.]
MAKPDSRTENVKRLEKTVKHTLEHANDSAQYLAEHADELSPQQVSDLQAKNERRLANVKTLEREIEEERRVEK